MHPHVLYLQYVHMYGRQIVTLEWKQPRAKVLDNGTALFVRGKRRLTTNHS